MWMKNTYISLDMIFIDDQKIVVGIEKNATPQSIDLITIKKPSKYVLEINAGMGESSGIQVGSKATFN